MLQSDSLSHPTWVRGLKRDYANTIASMSASHPTWVRGLKLIKVIILILIHSSHPTWVRGLKLAAGLYLGQWKGRTLRGCVD